MYAVYVEDQRDFMSSWRELFSAVLERRPLSKIIYPAIAILRKGKGSTRVYHVINGSDEKFVRDSAI